MFCGLCFVSLLVREMYFYMLILLPSFSLSLYQNFSDVILQLQSTSQIRTSAVTSSWHQKKAETFFFHFFLFLNIFSAMLQCRCFNKCRICIFVQKSIPIRVVDFCPSCMDSIPECRLFFLP